MAWAIGFIGHMELFYIYDAIGVLIHKENSRDNWLCGADFWSHK